MATTTLIGDEITKGNEAASSGHGADVEALASMLDRRGLDVAALITAIQGFETALPSWGVGTGGTRFGRFPGPGEPRGIGEKLEDCALVHQLTGATPRVSPHFPWDCLDDGDYGQLLARAGALGLGFDAVNSNTFQDQPGQDHSYKYGSLTHTDPGVRAQAIAHNVECIEIGRKLGAKALTVWIGDGANFPGQDDLTAAFDRYLASMAEIYSALPDDWQVFIEHKVYEPAFYATVIADWGSAYLAASELGPKAQCLVDLGHHAPNVNIEQIVARLIRFDKLGGFHFNDSKYGDDDLDSGSINPFQLFLVFNELVGAKKRDAKGFSPAYMIDQSHNVTDPIESLIGSVVELQRAYAQALLVDRDELAVLQNDNDVIGARELLKRAYQTDVTPLLAEARRQKGAAIEPLGVYRASGYRARKGEERPSDQSLGGGIV